MRCLREYLRISVAAIWIMASGAQTWADGNLTTLPASAPATTEANNQPPDFSDVACLDFALHEIGKPIDPIVLLADPRLNGSGQRSLADFQAITRGQGITATLFDHLTAR